MCILVSLVNAHQQVYVVKSILGNLVLLYKSVTKIIDVIICDGNSSKIVDFCKCHNTLRNIALTNVVSMFLIKSVGNLRCLN